jgi:alpha-mannosidase
VVDDILIEASNAVRTVVRIATHLADIPVLQRLALHTHLKRLDIENTTKWKTPHFIRLRQLFPLTQPNAALHYGVPFASNSTNNIMPKTGPHAPDEIKKESWRRSCHIHDWIHAGSPEWGLMTATDHQQIRLDDDMIRAEMLRGTRFTSVKVVRGGDVASDNYPPPGRYVFHDSLTSSSGDWRAAKACRSGMGLTNPLLPVSVVDAISRKPLPPSNSFCSLRQDNLALSALKKSDLDSSLLLRVCEIEGSLVKTGVEWLGASPGFRETNRIEEDISGAARQTLEAGPYAIRPLKLTVKKGAQ